MVNFTKDHLTTRFKVDVGVSYESDVEKVRKVLKEVAVKDDRVSNNPEPIVRFLDCPPSRYF